MTTVKRMPSRFRDGAPAGVFDIFDNPETSDRYTVVYEPFTYRNEIVIPFLAASDHPTHPQGIGLHLEMDIINFRAYRDRNRRYRIAWNELPEEVRAVVRHDLRKEG